MGGLLVFFCVLRRLTNENYPHQRSGAGPGTAPDHRTVGWKLL
jgi:hypothetical protein